MTRKSLTTDRAALRFSPFVNKPKTAGGFNPPAPRLRSTPRDSFIAPPLTHSRNRRWRSCPGEVPEAGNRLCCSASVGNGCLRGSASGLARGYVGLRSKVERSRLRDLVVIILDDFLGGRFYKARPPSSEEADQRPYDNKINITKNAL